MENFIKINGWEQSYEISNYGRIKCLNYLHHKDKVYDFFSRKPPSLGALAGGRIEK